MLPFFNNGTAEKTQATVQQELKLPNSPNFTGALENSLNKTQEKLQQVKEDGGSWLSNLFGGSSDNKPEPELPLGPRTPAVPRNNGFLWLNGGDRPETLDKALGNVWYKNDRPTVHNANNVDEHIKNLEQDNARIRSAYGHETNGQSADPGSSWWSWIPGSDESQAENRIEDNEAEIRRMKNEPELFSHLRDGTPAPGFLDHPIGWTANAFADNPWKTALGVGALGIGAWYLNKKQKEQQQKQNPFSFNRPQQSFTDRLKNLFGGGSNNNPSGSMYS